MGRGLNKNLLGVSTLLAGALSRISRPPMLTRLLSLLVLALLALALRAEEKPTALDATASRKPLDWNDPQWWMSRDLKPARITLGKSDFVLRGPLIQTFHPPARPAGEYHWTRRILDLPVVNLFVPQPMPPVGGPRKGYWSWGESDAPWGAIATHSRGGSSGGLVGLSW